MSRSKYVITITRQFGSMGRPIARKMAEILGIEYYDRDLVDQAAKKLNLPVSVIDKAEEKANSLSRNPFFRMYMPDDKSHKDILIDSSLLGVEGTAEYLVELVRRKFGDKKTDSSLQ